jgi:hypothetical protein
MPDLVLVKALYERDGVEATGFRNAAESGEVIKINIAIRAIEGA